MKKHLFLLFILFLFLVSCKQKMIIYDSIPIKYNRHIYFDVKVENKIKGNFMFDTGMTGIWLDSIFLKENNLHYKTQNIEIYGIGNLKKIVQLITDTIHYEYHNENFFSISAIMFNFKDIGSRKIDGVFGIETFARKPYIIDYVSQKIFFTDSVKGYEPISIQFKNRDIHLPLTITLKNGKKIQGQFILDTGSDQTILNSHLFMTDGIYNSTDKKKVFSIGGLGGNSDGYILPVTSVDLGKFRLKNLNISVSTDSLGALADTNYMGIIGNDLLDDFNILFDHQKEKIWIKPNKNFNKNPRKLFRGISFLETRNKWIVREIVENSEAYQQGVRIDDEIIEINHVSVKDIDFDEFVSSLKANDKLILKIKRENEVKEVNFKLNIFIKS